MPTANEATEELHESPVLPEIDTLGNCRPHGAADRIRLIADAPSPFTSVYLQTRPLLRDHERDVDRRWFAMRSTLERDGAPAAALRAIDARLALPHPPDTAGIGIITAADGRTIVDHALEPPRRDHGSVDTLPYVAPLFEWEQRRIPHLAVVAGRRGADIAAFTPDHREALDSVDGTRSVVIDHLLRAADTIGALLIVVGGEPREATAIADELARRSPPQRRVVTGIADDPDEMAEAVVRHVSDMTATTTVGYLRELRFLATHEAAADGLADTIAALRDRASGVLLIHDDPDDQRRVWLGTSPTDVSLERPSGWERTGRLVDACILAAVASNLPVHIIPSTGHTGPRDDVALLERPAGAPILHVTRWDGRLGRR